MTPPRWENEPVGGFLSLPYGARRFDADWRRALSAWTARVCQSAIGPSELKVLKWPRVRIQEKKALTSKSDYVRATGRLGCCSGFLPANSARWTSPRSSTRKRMRRKGDWLLQTAQRDEP